MVVSLHGGWGTGKTFFLKRWSRDLENRGFRSIYFNAWEDDFHDDPLIAVLGRMQKELGEPSFRDDWQRIARVVGDVLVDSAIGLVEKQSGLRLGAIFRRRRSGRLEAYARAQAAKEELRSGLESLSEKVWAETGHPLVFVIDELDRCRPSFAVQVLERVKHVFDVPKVVFVLGVNRDELCVVLKAVYGDIDADVYLRKFFDFEFQLSKVGEVDLVRSLMKRYGLVDYLAGVDGGERKFEDRLRGFPTVALRGFPELWTRFGLSLRDLEGCVRLLSLVVNEMAATFGSTSWLVGVMILLKFKDPTMYRRFWTRSVPVAR